MSQIDQDSSPTVSKRLKKDSANLGDMPSHGSSLGDGDAQHATNGKDKEDIGYFKSYEDIGIHEEMIADRVRTSTYRLAILKNYDSVRGKVVLDIGAGTGILSMFCVQAGAKKVYAVEASDMADQAKLVFSKNNASDKVTVLKGKVEEINIPEQVDVIVSEWMGYMLLYETMLPSVLLARDKWLKKDGVMMPGTATLYMAPITDPFRCDRVSFWDSVDDMYEVDMSCMKSFATKCFTSHVNVDTVDPENIMAHATKICSLDLHRVTVDEIRNMEGNFCFDCFGEIKIHGFVTWFDVGFRKNVVLSTSPESPPTHWQQCTLHLEQPFRVSQGTLIEGSIKLTPNKHYHRFLDIHLEYTVNGEASEQQYLMDDFMT